MISYHKEIRPVPDRAGQPAMSSASTSGDADAPDRGREGPPWRARLQNRAVQLLLGLVGLVLISLIVPVYLVLVLVVNVPRYLAYVVRQPRLWARVVGTATIQRQLEGKVLERKEKVLRLALEIEEQRGSTASAGEGQPGQLTEDDVRRVKEVIGYRAESAPDQFSLYLPGRQLYDRYVASPAGVAEEATQPAAEASPEPTGVAKSKEILERVRVTQRQVEGMWRPTRAEPRPIAPGLVWAITAMSLLRRGEKELARNTKTAYRAFLQAERMLVYGEYERAKTNGATRADGGQRVAGGDAIHPLRTRAKVVLDAARRRFDESAAVVEELLCADVEDEPEPKEDLTTDELVRAMAVLHEAEVEDYLRIEDLRITILGFVGLPFVMLAGLVVLYPSFMGSALEPITNTLPTETVTIPWTDLSAAPRVDQVFYVLVLLFGAIGAAISGMRKIDVDSGSLKQLGEVLGYWLALVRIVIGAMSAFIVVVLLFSGFLDVQKITLPMVLGISLAAGFSERLAIRAIASFEQRTFPDFGRQSHGERP